MKNKAIRFGSEFCLYGYSPLVGNVASLIQVDNRCDCTSATARELLDQITKEVLNDEINNWTPYAAKDIHGDNLRWGQHDCRINVAIKATPKPNTGITVSVAIRFKDKSKEDVQFERYLK